MFQVAESLSTEPFFVYSFIDISVPPQYLKSSAESVTGNCDIYLPEYTLLFHLDFSYIKYRNRLLSFIFILFPAVSLSASQAGNQDSIWRC